MSVEKGSMRNTKTIRVLLVQPPCEDRETLLRLLKRVGFLTDICWPPVPAMFEYADVVFVAFRAIFEEGVKFAWKGDDPPAALVALLDFENPSIVNAAIKLNAHAVLGMPIRSFGVVANVFVALKNHQLQVELTGQISRLRSRIECGKLLTRAKEILIVQRGQSEEEAHRTLRSLAMNKRVSIEEVARAIVSAEEIMSDLEAGMRSGSK